MTWFNLHMGVTLLGKAASCAQSFAHHSAHKYGPWAWNTSLPRDKKLMQPIPGLCPCVGISCLVSGSLCSTKWCINDPH